LAAKENAHARSQRVSRDPDRNELCNAAYIAGQHLEFSKAPAQQLLSLAPAIGTGSILAVTLDLSTFAKIDPPPPLVPPGDRQLQG